MSPTLPLFGSLLITKCEFYLVYKNYLGSYNFIANEILIILSYEHPQGSGPFSTLKLLTSSGICELAIDRYYFDNCFQEVVA
jgi:hypothetical protein